MFGKCLLMHFASVWVFKALRRRDYAELNLLLLSSGNNLLSSWKPAMLLAVTAFLTDFILTTCAQMLFNGLSVLVEFFVALSCLLGLLIGLMQ